MAEKKTRLDVAVFERGLSDSRAKASALIMAGQVFVNGQKVLKSGQNVKEDDKIEVRGEKMPFVSRGGYKLDKAVKAFDLSLKDKICMDIGASTGGFTDCMLQNGAAKVFSVDVGYGQLAWKLRTDERVVNMERTNFRYLTIDDIGTKLDFASVDVSFISLKIILPVLFELLNDGGEAVCLIKPQFEAGEIRFHDKVIVERFHRLVLLVTVLFMMLAHILLRLLRCESGREVTLVIRHEIIGYVNREEHTALENLRAGTLEMVIYHFHPVNLAGHIFAAQFLRYLLTPLRIRLVCKLSEITGDRQSEFRHFLCHLSSNGVDNDVAGSIGLVLRNGLLHLLYHVVVETAAQAAVAREHHQSDTLHTIVRHVKRSAHVRHGSEKRFQNVLQTVLIRQHVADKRLGVMKL